jgi:hypothetical protein
MNLPFDQFTAVYALGEWRAITPGTLKKVEWLKGSEGVSFFDNEIQEVVFMPLEKIEAFSIFDPEDDEDL